MEQQQETVVVVGKLLFYQTPEQRAAVALCPVCGEPRDESIAPCGHDSVNVRKCAS